MVRAEPTIAEQSKLTASDAVAEDRMGNSVDIDGDIAVVGAYRHDGAGGPNDGAAYDFERDGASWGQTAILTASDASADDEFGWVAIDGDVIVVGAPGYDGAAGVDQGIAYVYVKPPGGWTDMTETAVLLPTDIAADYRFGSVVAVWGDAIVVGAFGFDGPAGTNQGTAHVFVEPPGGWTNMAQTATLWPSITENQGWFGFHVDIEQDTIVVTASNEDGATLNEGAAYVYVKPPGGWGSTIEDARLTAGDAASGDNFGRWASIDGDAVCIGAYRADSGLLNSDRGAAYVFERPVTGWAHATHTAKLTASDPAVSDQLGICTALSGDFAVVGAYLDDEFAGVDQGSAYVYVRPDGGWVNATETLKLTASDASAQAHFAQAAAVDGGTLLLGARHDPGPAGIEQGAGYIYTLCRCAGDVDLDRAYDGGDAQAFIQCVIDGGAACACADMDGSGAADPTDTSAFVQRLLLAPPCP